MTRRDWSTLALVAVAVGALTAANVCAAPPVAAPRTPCHRNLTCDKGLTCYAVDGARECARKVERVDARGSVCMDVAGARGCYATLADCQVARGVVVHGGGKAGDCALVTYPQEPGGAR